MTDPVSNPSLDERFSGAVQNAENARANYEVFNSITPPPVNVANNSDPELATNWTTIFSATTEEMKAGSYLGLVQVIWNINQSNRKGYFETFIDGNSLGILSIPIVDSTAQAANPLFFLPHFVSDFSTDTTHTIETKALISSGGGTPSMTIDNMFFLFSRTG